MINYKKIINQNIKKRLENIFNAFKNHGFEIKIVGGFIRDFMLDLKKEKNDIDFSTTANTDEIREICAKIENIKILNVGGEEFGTLVLLDEKTHEKFEITSCRQDLQTFGRHAKTVFCKDFFTDSQRRDFAINALYSDLNGNILDFHNGILDIKQKKIRFIGNAKTRIQEDFLRIIRYFRFVNLLDTDFDENLLKICKENADGLKILSTNRCIMEFSKMFEKKSKKTLKKMIECDVFSSINLSFSIDLFEKIDEKCTLIKQFQINESDLRLAVLFFENDEKSEKYLSKEQKNIIKIWKNNKETDIFTIFAKSSSVKQAAIYSIFHSKNFDQDIEIISKLQNLTPPKINIEGLKGAEIGDKILREKIDFYKKEIK